MAGADVEEAKLVGACGVIGARGLDRIARVAEVDEIDPLDDAAVGDVEAGNDADADGHGKMPPKPVRAELVEAPFFSRPEERRVGKECVSKCRSRWSP